MDVLMGYVYPSTSLPIYQHPMGVPFGGVPLCTTRTVGSPSPRAVSRRLTLRLLGGVPFGDGNSCCHSFSLCGENVLLCIPLMGNDR